MGLPPTSTGSARKRHRTEPFRAVGAAALALWLAGGAALAQDPAKLLDNERAFAFSAQALDDRTVEARFAVADGYYLYRDKIRFSVEPGALVAAPALPPGQVKDDEFFGRVETYRGRLAVKLPLDRLAPDRKVTIRAESQGCADVGVCYPPQVQSLTLVLPAPGARPGPPVEAAPARKSWFN